MKRAEKHSRAALFWSRVHRAGAQACWLWLGSRLPTGYGKMSFRGKAYYAHRLAWEFSRGSAPGRLCVCHTCDNPQCVNPAHLFLGSPRDNLHDAKQKGRIQSGRDHWSHRMPSRVSRGSGKLMSATLAEAEVLSIRTLYAAGKTTHAKLAAMFSVTDRTIGKIVRGERWKHVGGLRTKHAALGRPPKVPKTWTSS